MQVTSAELEALLALPITPGPWVACPWKEGMGAQGDLILGPDGAVVVSVSEWVSVSDDDLTLACAAPTLLRALAEARAEVERLRKELAEAKRPKWFYNAHGDLERPDYSVGDVVSAYFDWTPPDVDPHAWAMIEVSTATSLDTIWVTARMRTDEEKEASGTDDDFELNEHATEAEARAALEGNKS